MADIFSKIKELVWWALSYPVPLVWIGLGMAVFVGLIGVVGMVVGLKMKRDDRETAQTLKASVPPSATPS